MKKVEDKEKERKKECKYRDEKRLILNKILFILGAEMVRNRVAGRPGGIRRKLTDVEFGWSKKLSHILVERKR